MARPIHNFWVILSSVFVLFACTNLAPKTPNPPETETKTLHVMTSGGFAAAYHVLKPQFEAETGYQLETIYGSSSGGAIDSIPERLKRGEHTDIVILSQNGLKRITDAGHIDPGSHVDLVRSMIGMAVKQGADVPNISTEADFLQTVMDAESIGYSASASGTYLSTNLFPRLGIWEEISGKSTRILSKRVASLVASGDYEIGFQQISEILPIEGITYVGPIPDSFQKVTTFSTGIALSTDDRAGAEALIAYLSAWEQAEQIAATGLSPVATE